MNCLYESVAQAYLRVRTSFFFVPAIEDDLGEAEETLEGHRASLAAREREAEMQYVASGRAALAKRKAGDLGGAKYHLQARIFLFFLFLSETNPPPPPPQERKRGLARLEKLRSGLALLDKQLDALHSNEIDRVLVNSMRASSQAMKKAGIGIDAEEAEKVMNELGDQIQEASEVTSVFSTPIMAGGDEGQDIGMDEVDRELGLIAEEDSALLACAEDGGAAAEIPSAPAAAALAQEPARPARQAARASFDY